MIIPYIYIRYLLYIIFFVGLPVLLLILLKIFQKWTLGKCKSLVCLTGKTAIVTGGTSGIGYETALLLASRGCRVIIADKEGGIRARNKIIQNTNNTNVVVKYLDLASFKSIREFAKDINETEERLDILINNAGVATVGNKYTEDGLHETMQINHFGPFLLTHLLTDLLKKSAPSRIIFVSSAAAFFSNLSIENLNYPKDHPLSLFRTALIYGNSKLCNVISANGFAERLEDYGVTCNSLHPGWINTKIMKNAEEWTALDGLEQVILSPISYMYAKNQREGAQTTVHLALSNSVKEVTGKHFWDCITFPLPPGARNEKFCKDIWEESEIFVKLSEKEKLHKMNIKENIELIAERKENEEELKVSTGENSGNEDTELLMEVNGGTASENDEMNEDSDSDYEQDEKIENSSQARKNTNGFSDFGKSKNGESFITMNGNIEYNEAKERS